MPPSHKNPDTDKDRCQLDAGTRLVELTAIARECAQRPVVSLMTDEEILGYDEWGVPTR